MPTVPADTTQDFPIVMIAVDGSNKIFVVRDGEGDSYYYTPIAGWWKWADVPLKDAPGPEGHGDGCVYHNDLWWPERKRRCCW